MVSKSHKAPISSMAVMTTLKLFIGDKLLQRSASNLWIGYITVILEEFLLPFYMPLFSWGAFELTTGISLEFFSCPLWAQIVVVYPWIWYCALCQKSTPDCWLLGPSISVKYRGRQRGSKINGKMLEMMWKEGILRPLVRSHIMAL